MLPAIAASTSSTNGSATAAIVSQPERCIVCDEAAPVDRDVVRLRDQAARAIVVMPALIEPENDEQDQRRRGEHEPGVDLLALGDVAALQRLVEPLLRRVF